MGKNPMLIILIVTLSLLLIFSASLRAFTLQDANPPSPVMNVSPAEKERYARHPADGSDRVPPHPKSLEGIDILTGFTFGRLKSGERYQTTPLMIGFAFNVRPLLQKFNINCRNMLQLLIEPFLSLLTEPAHNFEAGTGFYLKAGLLAPTSRVQPYLKAGFGAVFMHQHLATQATQFNFIEQAGLGMHIFGTPQTALTLEYRYSHLSNAGIEHPNNGIDSHITLLGLSYRF
jgi:lipid A 3-O-deacylase